MPTRCLRCGRPLRDADSRRRGYGPVCWEKVRGSLPPGEIPLTQKRSISNHSAASHSLDALNAPEGSRCPFCGALLASASASSYDHPEGVTLNGFTSPQWVFFSCPSCKLDISLHKLTRDKSGNLCRHSKQITLAEIFSI